MIGFENGSPVPIVLPCMDAMDSFADSVREDLARGKSHEQIVQEAVEKMLAEQKWEAIAAALMRIIDASKPRLEARLTMYASGIMAEGNLTLPEIARLHGITKQAAQQGVRRIVEDLNLPLTSFMRSVEARESMRKFNFRKPKIT